MLKLLSEIDERLRIELLQYRGHDLVWIKWAERWRAEAHFIMVHGNSKGVAWAERETLPLLRETGLTTAEIYGKIKS